MKRTNGAIWVVAVISIIGLAGLAFAHGGGYGSGMMGGGMMGPGMMGDGYGHGYGMMNQGRGYGQHMGDYGYGNLSREQADRLEKARESFSDNTRQLRNDIRDKQFALNDELNKSDPDVAKVGQLQKELSELKSDYDQKALAFELETRKILPEGSGGRGFGPGYGNRVW